MVRDSNFIKDLFNVLFNKFDKISLGVFLRVFSEEEIICLIDNCLILLIFEESFLSILNEFLESNKGLWSSSSSILFSVEI